MNKKFARVMSIIRPVLNLHDVGNWFLIGSVAANCLGVQNNPKDIDIFVSYGGIPRIYEFLKPWAVSNDRIDTDEFKARKLELKIDGVRVEILEELHYKDKKGQAYKIFKDGGYYAHTNPELGLVNLPTQENFIMGLYRMGRPKDLATIKKLRLVDF